MLRLWRRIVDTWESLNRQAEDERAAHPGFDRRVPIVLVCVALVLVFQEYYGDRPNFETYFPQFESSRWFALEGFAWWAGAKVLGYLVLPSLLVWGVLRGRVADYGFSFKGLGRHLWIYVALYLAILPLVVAASYTRPFLEHYPFYKQAARSWTDFIAWELMYGASFLALEFFFRGFLLQSLKRTMGAYAIFVMAVPYCMIHFHKNVAEVIGAIFAGIILGTLAMATRSIWLGVFIHISVAWTMDILALAHTVGFPGNDRFVG
jgi:membrane protease YdiL (CAAX protease family)